MTARGPRADGPPVLVLLPGMLMTERLWQHQHDDLARRAIVVQVPLRSHGIDGLVDDVLALPYARFSLAGLSLGAIVAMAVARRSPDRVQRLALLSTNARPPRPDQHRTWRDMADRTARGEFARITPETLLPLLLHPDRLAERALTDAVVAMADQTGPTDFLAQLAAQHSRVDERPALPAVRCPTLVVAGAQDALCPVAYHEEIAALVPGARLEVLDGCGHTSPLERPEAVTDLLLDWLPDPPYDRSPTARGVPMPDQLPDQLPDLLKSPVEKDRFAATLAQVRETVSDILADVRERGDDAVREYSQKFDQWSPDSFRLSPDDIERIVATVPSQALEDIRFAQAQVRTFAEHQRASLSDFEVETLPGVRLGQRNVPVSSSGAYVPGGRYPLTASAHMTILTAKVAGVPRVATCTPPIRGEVPAATVAAMHAAGADEIYLLGGVQAVAALALGTETIGRVDLIAGPGNAYVAEAKRQLFGEVGIDLFAGPTEILVIADDTADPFVVAVDLLSQAEHGPDSPAVLITTSAELGRAVLAHVEAILPGMPTLDMAGPAWRDHGAIHVVDDLEAAFALADELAFEHVEVLTAEPRRALDRMRNYGALFLGEGTTVSYGDKVIGTNHVLPTRGASRYTGGLWVGKFLKTVTYQEVTDPASSALLGEVCGRASRVELFEGHARSGDVRAAKYGGAAVPASLPWTHHDVRAGAPAGSTGSA